MSDLATWRPPTDPSQWLRAAQIVLDHFLQAVARFGIRPSPDLRLVASDSAFPYYEHATETICVGMPDPETAAGRLYWLFVSRLTGAAGVAGAIESAGVRLPFLIAHEATHHLRHHYGAPTDNDFIEEQVANTVALAYVRETAAFQDVVEQIVSTAAAADKSLDALAADVRQYVGGFRLNLTDVLLGTSSLSAAEVDRVVAFARAIHRPVDEVLNETLFSDPEKRRSAERMQRESRSYFNQTYLNDLATYAQFFSGWLQWYGKSGSPQPLGAVLLEHILSPDWALTRERETHAFLHSLLDHPVDDLAAAAAEFLANQPAQSATAYLLLSSPRTVVRVAALRALPAGTAALGGPSLERIQHCLVSPDRDEATAATALLLAAVGSGAVEAERHAVLETSGLVHAIAAPGNDRLDALRALLARRIDIATTPGLVRPVVDTLTAPRASERSVAACLLAVATPNEAFAGQLAPLLADRDPIVRRDALRAYARHQDDRTELERVLLLALADPSEGVRNQGESLLVGEAIDDADVLDPGAAGRDWDVRIRLCRVAAAGTSHQRAGELAADLLDDLSFWQAQLDALFLVISREAGSGWELVRLAVAEEQQRLMVLAVRTVQALDQSAALALVLEGMTSHDSAASETALALARKAPLADDDLRAKLLALLTPAKTEHPATGPVNADEIAASYPEAFLGDLVREAQRTRSEPAEMLTATEKLVFLHSTPFFALSPIRQLRQLADSAVVRAYSAGECIIDAGALPDAVHVVASGTVRVARLDAGGGELLGPRQSFGELELLSGRRCTFEATAAERCTLISVPGDRLFACATADPGLLLRWTQMLSARVLDQIAAATPDAGDVARSADGLPRERGLSYVWQVPPDLLQPTDDERARHSDDERA